MPSSNASKLYVVMLEPRKGVTRAQIEKKMNLARDWFYTSENFWILYTTSDAAKWMERLLPLAKPEGSLFISKLDSSDRQGWMHEKFWEWLEGKE